MAFQRVKKDEWIIAIRNRSSSLLVNGNYNDFKFVPNTLRYWCADPFLFSHSGKCYLFFEMYDRIKRKGALGFRIINEDGTYSKITKCYEASTHLSYPFIFCNENDEIFMMPESSRSQELYLLRAKNFPFEWEKIVISSNVKLVDTTLFKYNDCVYAYSTRIAQDNVSQLELYMFDEPNRKLLSHPINPIKNDKLGGRMGGRVFAADNKLIRFAQDSRNGYGGGGLSLKL